MNIFITGTSSGLGQQLAAQYLTQGHKVFGISRKTNNLNGLIHTQLDLALLETIETALSSLLHCHKLDLVVLNAGILGEIKPMTETAMNEIKNIMNINVWANKIIMDWLITNKPTKQLVLISSGAAVNGNKGWGGYSLSKATLNMLTKMYANENLSSHYCAVAPGLIDTQMQDYLCGNEKLSSKEYPSLLKLRAARHTEHMPNAKQAASNLISVFEQLKSYPSGSFVDVRTME
ncbi:MAG: SDR family NAD(P)-dependent oxidoreductase [bacterium]